MEDKKGLRLLGNWVVRMLDNEDGPKVTRSERSTRVKEGDIGSNRH